MIWKDYLKLSEIASYSKLARASKAPPPQADKGVIFSRTLYQKANNRVIVSGKTARSKLALQSVFWYVCSIANDTGPFTSALTAFFSYIIYSNFFVLIENAKVTKPYAQRSKTPCVFREISHVFEDWLTRYTSSVLLQDQHRLSTMPLPI